MESQVKQSISYIQFELWLDCFIYNNRYILWLRRNYKTYTNFILLLTSPYILLNWMLCKIYACTNWELLYS